MLKIALLSGSSDDLSNGIQEGKASIIRSESFKQLAKSYTKSPVDAVVIDEDLLTKQILKKISSLDFNIKPPLFVLYKKDPEIIPFIHWVKSGVDSYITKPLNYTCLIDRIREVTHFNCFQKQFCEINSKWPGKSLITQSLKQKIHLYAKKPHNILLLGETGCGKSFIAQEIHNISTRSDEPFCNLDCSCITSSLFESELFGTVEGAYTDSKDRAGFLEKSGRGTLFIDEIGEIPPFLQAKLLKVIDDGVYYPVGSTRPKRLKARIIAATNRNLQKRIKKGLFRKDLYYRLKTLDLKIPPLREHKEDIPGLVIYFLKKIESSKKITHQALKKMYKYNWPGNIRELLSIVKKADTLSDTAPWIESSHIQI